MTTLHMLHECMMAGTDVKYIHTLTHKKIKKPPWCHVTCFAGGWVFLDRVAWRTVACIRRHLAAHQGTHLEKHLQDEWVRITVCIANAARHVPPSIISRA